MTTTALDSDLERLIRRAGPLTFGIFGTIGRDDDMTAEEGGSGVFVAPFLGLTARHISEHLLRLDSYHERPHKRRFRTEHAVGAFQVLDPLEKTSRQALWHADESWNSAYADLTLIQFSAEDATADHLQYNWPSRFFDLQLLPPDRGSKVIVMGFPKLSTKAEGSNRIDIGAPFTVKEGAITKLYWTRADLGMLKFPCFELDIHLAGGYSGGPVFFGNRLCGIVSHGTSFDARSTIAMLWPLALMKATSELGEWTVRNMLDNGRLDAVDWRDVKGRISIREDEHGRHAHLDGVGESDVRDS